MRTKWEVECRCTDMVTDRTVTHMVTFYKFAVGNNSVTGRPSLLERLWPAITVLFRAVNPKTAKQSKHFIRRFWSFLDEMDALRIRSVPTMRPIDDLDWNELELFWRHWIDWLRASDWSQKEVSKTFWYVKKVLETAFELDKEQGGTEKEALELFGYFRSPRQIKIVETLQFEDVRKIFKSVRKKWFESVARVGYFNKLADTGHIHWRMASEEGKRRETLYWSRLCNRLWFIREYFPWQKKWGSDCPLKDPAAGFLQYEPPNWAPITPWSKKGAKINAHLGAIYLTFEDLAIAIALVAMKTPFNSSTIGSLRASHWFIRDPQHPDRRVVIFARKARSKGGVQKAYSSINSSSDPYRIISTVIELTEPLRQIVRRKAKLLRIKPNRNKQEERELEKLTRLSDAVWLYPSQNNGVMDIGPLLGGAANYEIHKVIKSVLHNTTAKDGTRLSFHLKDGREMWALYVYERSGHSLLLTQLTLSHTGLSSIARYLNSRVLRVKNFLKLSKLHERVLSELMNGKYDPVTLRQLVNDGAISNDIAYKLAESVPSSFGLRCTDPKNPDIRADPGHSKGELCRLQLCPFCTKWYATADSVAYLQRALLDLDVLEASIGILIWETSSYPLWQALFQEIVSKFHIDIQKKGIEKAKKMAPIITPRMFIGPKDE